MPNYEYECEKCGKIFDLTLKLVDLDNEQPCVGCGSTETKRNIVSANFILVGDDWPGKSIRVNGQMYARREKVGRKEKEMAREEPLVTLVPNVGGEETDTWSEAKQLAKSKDKDGSTFDGMIQKEQSGDL